MSWVTLIFVISVSKSVSTATAEFETTERCTEAAEMLVEQWGLVSNVSTSWVCVPSR